jgi:hypothetical protein
VKLGRHRVASFLCTQEPTSPFSACPIRDSVEPSCRLMAVAGWLRFVCLNSMTVGTALMHLRQQHRQQLQVEELGRLLTTQRLATAVQRHKGSRPEFAEQCRSMPRYATIVGP